MSHLDMKRSLSSKQKKPLLRKTGSIFQMHTHTFQALRESWKHLGNGIGNKFSRTWGRAGRSNAFTKIFISSHLSCSSSSAPSAEVLQYCTFTSMHNIFHFSLWTEACLTDLESLLDTFSKFISVLDSLVTMVDCYIVPR